MLTEGNEKKENFSSLKTFENLVLLNNSSDNLESELNKANNYSSNKNQNNSSKIINTNNSNSDLENDSINLNFNSINNNNKNLINNTNNNKDNNDFNKNDCDEYENLVYKPSDLQEINKQSIKIPGLDGLIAKNSLGKIKNINEINYSNNSDNNRNLNIIDNNANENDFYFKAKSNIKEIKATENNFLPNNEQTTLNLSDKSLNNNNNFNKIYNNNNNNLNISNPIASSLNLKSDSFTNTMKNVNFNSLSDFNNNKNNVSNISLANSSNYNLNRDLLLENPNNILEHSTSAEKKKNSFDFHLNKENSFKRKTNESAFVHNNPLMLEKLNNISNNCGSNISIANGNPNIYLKSLEINSSETIANYNKEKNLIENKNFKDVNKNISKTNTNLHNKLNLNLNFNDLIKKISEEDLIQENEEKINISSHKVENIHIKSFDTCKHMYRNSELPLDQLELEKIHQMYNFNLATEESITNAKNAGAYSPKEKQSQNLNLNLQAEKNNFHTKFVNENNINNNNNINFNFNNSLSTPRQTVSNGPNYKLSLNSHQKLNIDCTAAAQKPSSEVVYSYSQTSRNVTHMKNFGNILVNLEKEKLEFEKNFETHVDLDSLKKSKYNFENNNNNNNNERSKQNSSKVLKKIDNNQFTKENNNLINNSNNKNKNFNNSESNSNSSSAAATTQINFFKSHSNQISLGNLSTHKSQNPVPIPSDNLSIINFDSLNLMQKEDQLYVTRENKDLHYSTQNYKSSYNSFSNMKNNTINQNNYLSEKSEFSDFGYSGSSNRSILANKDEKPGGLGHAKKLSFNLPINQINSETNNLADGFTSLSSRDQQAATYNFNTYNFSNISSNSVNCFNNSNIYANNDKGGENKDFARSAPGNFVQNSDMSSIINSPNYPNMLSTLNSNNNNNNFKNNFYDSKESSSSAATEFQNNSNNIHPNRLILSQDDLLTNESNNLNENLFKIKPHHEPKKQSLTRLGTIIEVLEGEKEKEKEKFLSSSCSDLNLLKKTNENLNQNNNIIFKSSDCGSIKENYTINNNNDNNNFNNFDLNKQIIFEKTNKINCKDSPGIDNKMNISRYSTLNIRDIMKDKDKFEKINLHSRCNTEGFEDDSPKENDYCGNNLSRISSKSDTLSAECLSAKKNTNLYSDKEKTPV